MPEVTRRRTGEFVRKLFEILLQHPDGMHGREALAALRKQVELTDYEKGAFPSQPDTQRFDVIVRFATVDCVKAGWLAKQKGRWTVTEAGKKAFEDSALRDPEAFYRQAVRLYHQWKASQPGDAEPQGAAEIADTDKVASITFEEAEEQAWAEIEQYLREMNPYDFQELVAALLRAMSYHVSWIAPPGKDGGIDIVAWSDPLGTRPPRIKVQVKRVQQKVSVDGLRSFMAVLGADDSGLFVSTGGFTKDAEEAARTQETRKVTLVDLEKLFDLWVEYYDQLEDDARRRLPLRPIQFLDPGNIATQQVTVARL
jgi:restriction system protein